MSEADYYETYSDSFWEIGQYKRTVKRTEESYKLCNDLMQMLSERASLEKLYSKSLKSWSKKWCDYLDKSYEYGSMKSTWNAVLQEANRISDIHNKVHDDLEDGLIIDIKSWQKTFYPKTLMSHLKVVKQFEEEFSKAQKPWAKKYASNEKNKKEYHNTCKLLQSARIQETNAKNDANLGVEQKKKYEDKVDKLKKEVESAKHKYQQTLDDINTYNSHYIEDMKAVYKKCDSFERQRLEFFIQKFCTFHEILDLTQKPVINQIYTDLIQTIKSSNPDRDLQAWSKANGATMNMNWPQFEEYSEELKPINKSIRASRYNKDLTSEDGVTMTSMRQKDEFVAQQQETSSIRRRLSLKKLKRGLSFIVHSERKSNRQELMSRSESANLMHTLVRNNSAINSRSKLAPIAPTPTSIESYPSEQNPFEVDDDINVENINSTKIASGSQSNEMSKRTVHQESLASKSNPFDSDDESGNNDAIITRSVVVGGGGGGGGGGSTAVPNEYVDDTHEDDNYSAVNSQALKNSIQNGQATYLNIKVKAIYDYQSTEDDELTFKSGDEFLKLANEDDRGWCLGKFGERIGLYPATYAIDL